MFRYFTVLTIKLTKTFYLSSLQSLSLLVTVKSTMYQIVQVHQMKAFLLKDDEEPLSTSSFKMKKNPKGASVLSPRWEFYGC